MATSPTSRIQNQGADLHFEIEDHARLKPEEAKVAGLDGFKDANPFQHFLNKLKEKAPSFMDSLKQAALNQKEGAEGLPAKAPAADAGKAGEAEVLPQSLETVFVEFFGKNGYTQLPSGTEARYTPKSAKAWDEFLNQNLAKLGTWVQEMKMQLGERVRAAIYRGLIQTPSEAALIGDFLLNPANQYGRNPRLAFLQVLLPEEAVAAFRDLKPGDPISRELIDLIGKEASVRRLAPKSPEGQGDGGQQALLRLKSGVSDGQVRFESLVMASRRTLEEEAPAKKALERDERAPRLPWGFPIPFFLGRGREGKGPEGRGSNQKLLLGYWIIAIAVVLVLYFLIQSV